MLPKSWQQKYDSWHIIRPVDWEFKASCVKGRVAGVWNWIVTRDPSHPQWWKCCECVYERVEKPLLFEETNEKIENESLGHPNSHIWTSGVHRFTESLRGIHPRFHAFWKLETKNMSVLCTGNFGVAQVCIHLKSWHPAGGLFRRPPGIRAARAVKLSPSAAP